MAILYLLLFSSISFHWSLRKAFLSLLAVLQNSAFRWLYLPFPHLPFTLLLFLAICKGSSDNLLAFCISFSWERFWSLPPEEPLDEGKRGEWKTDLTLNIQEKIMTFGPITSWQIEGKTMETVRLYFYGFQNHYRWWLQPWN